MLTTIIIVKLDNGYKAVITDYIDDNVIVLGTSLMNRQFKAIPSGSYAFVTVNVTSKLRRTVRNFRVAEDREVAEIRSGISQWKQTLAQYQTGEKKVTATNKTSSKESTPLDDYYLSKEARSTFTTAYNMSKAMPSKAVKVMMVGPSGYGKTTLPRLFSQVVGKDFMRMNCATIRDPEEWFGYREAKEGSTLFIKSQFAKAIEKGNLVVVLDEFNRLEPWLHNTLFPLLDDDGCTVVHDEKFSIGEGVIVVATINSGFKYTGTFELDEALFNRFDLTLEVGPMPYKEEVNVLKARTGVVDEVADNVVKMASILRDNTVVCSTRTTLLVCKMIVSGMSIREAFEAAVVRRIPVESSGSGLRKQVIDLINVRLGVFVPDFPKDDVFSPASEQIESNNNSVMTTIKTVLKADASLGQFLPIPIIKALRKMPTPKAIDLVTAKKYTDLLREGRFIYLELTEEVDATMVSTFRTLGVKLTTEE